MRTQREVRATGRELQVLELAAEGNTDKQIALVLDISKDTVASYWRRILLKYNAASRTEVVARHAQQMFMAKAEEDRAEESKEDDEQLIAEISSRTLAQANELAQRNLLQAITEVSLEFISGRTGFRQVFERCLEEILGLTQSEYGFLAEVLFDENEAPYLKTHAITNIAWNKQTMELYENNYEKGLEFRNLETLFGRVLTSGNVLIANEPTEDPRRGGLPPGHPAMTAFLGIPVYSGGDLVGMLGLANRPGGYDEGLLDYLRPIVATCANFIVGLRAEQERRAIEERLAESVTLTKLLTDAVQTAVLFEDCNRTLKWVNRAFLQIFGASGNPEDFVGMDCALVAEHSRPLFADPDGFMALVDQRLKDKKDALGDMIRLANGELYERDFIVVQKDGVHIGYLWKYRKVSAWRMEHETLSGVLDSSLDAVVVLNAQGLVEYWNSRAVEIFGYSEIEAMGNSLGHLIVPPELREAHEAGLARFRETRQSKIMDQVIQIYGQTKSGERVDVSLIVSCIDSGPEPRFSAFIRPVEAK